MCLSGYVMRAIDMHLIKGNLLTYLLIKTRINVILLTWARSVGGIRRAISSALYSDEFDDRFKSFDRNVVHWLRHVWQLTVFPPFGCLPVSG